MKSVKRGRAPSMMGGIVGIFMVCFGIFWTVIAAQAHWIMALFGICWTGIAVFQTVYNFKNARSKNRYSEFDIVDSHEEIDPWDEKYGHRSSDPRNSAAFCPYCGSPSQPDFEFCPKCGRKLP